MLHSKWGEGMKYLLAVLPVILIILLIMPIKFIIDFKYGMEQNRLKIVTSYLFGLIKPEIYPFDEEKRRRKHKTGLLDRIKSLKRDEDYRFFLEAIWDKLVIDSINLEIRIGFEDAYYVGVTVGFLWFIKSLLFSYLLNKKDVKRLNYNVIPVFKENQLDIQFNCIIKIRMVYIITVWIWMLKSNRGGEKLDRASYRRINENYNE